MLAARFSRLRLLIVCLVSASARECTFAEVSADDGDNLLWDLKNCSRTTLTSERYLSVRLQPTRPRKPFSKS